MPCSNAAKTPNPLKLAWVPQTNETISAASGPKFTILCAHVEEILLLNKFFFPIVNNCLSCEDIARQNCGMVPRWRFFASFLRPVFSGSHMQHISAGFAFWQRYCTASSSGRQPNFAVLNRRCHRYSAGGHHVGPHSSYGRPME